MKYSLRHFENNYQIISSLGWLLIVLGIINLFIGPIPAAIIMFGLGAFFIWLQLRGKRIKVNTSDRTIKAKGKTRRLNSPTTLYMNEVRVAQNVNSHVNSASVKTYFYKAYILDGDEPILISCNKKEDRDLENLKRIAKDLEIPFRLNY